LTISIAIVAVVEAGAGSGAAPSAIWQDPGNLNRAQRTNPALTRTDAPTTSGRRDGRPPVTWTWVD
jgi:hypothetical protein